MSKTAECIDCKEEFELSEFQQTAPPYSMFLCLFCDLREDINELLWKLKDGNEAQEA